LGNLSANSPQPPENPIDSFKNSELDREKERQRDETRQTYRQIDTLLSFRVSGVNYSDKHSMVHKAIQNSGRRKRGQSTAEGRQRQIVSRLNHGIRCRSLVLLPIESEAEWQQHLEGFRQSYAPVGEVEECLVHLIAYQFWRWIGRLIPYERDLTLARMTTPKESLIGDECSSADIQKVLCTPAAELTAQENAARRQLARYEALGNGQSDSLEFSAPEVEELVGLFHRRLTNGDVDDDENEGADLDDGVPIFDGENRTWSAADVQEQLRILCEAAGEDWRAKLYYVLYDYRHELEERLAHLAEAKEHITYSRILGMEELDRLCLYERQISASFRHLVSQLERHQARRLGVPVPAPVAVDLSVSHHGALSEIP
jgi:hypothetical protein